MVSVTGQNHDAFRFNGSKRASYVLEKICLGSGDTGFNSIK